MLDFTTVMAVLPASDIGRARAFYTDTLGLTPDPGMEEAEGSAYTVGDGRFLLYATSFAGTAKNTALTLATNDLDSTMTEMRQRGVTFEEYDMPGLKTENGVAAMGTERGAWFIDSEGNIIAVAERA